MAAISCGTSFEFHDFYSQVPIDVTAGWAASPVDTRSPFNSWVNWSTHTHPMHTHTTLHMHTTHIHHVYNTTQVYTAYA